MLCRLSWVNSACNSACTPGQCRFASDSATLEAAPSLSLYIPPSLSLSLTPSFVRATVTLRIPFGRGGSGSGYTIERSRWARSPTVAGHGDSDTKSNAVVQDNHHHHHHNHHHHQDGASTTKSHFSATTHLMLHLGQITLQDVFPWRFVEVGQPNMGPGGARIGSTGRVQHTCTGVPHGSHTPHLHPPQDLCGLRAHPPCAHPPSSGKGIGTARSPRMESQHRMSSASGSAGACWQ